MEESPCGTQVLLLLPHDLLSSSCRSDSNRPIAHSNLFFLYSLSLFFVVRSFISSSSLDCSFLLRQIIQIVQSPTQIYSSSLLHRCSSSSDHWFLFRSVLHRQIVGSSSGLFFIVKSLVLLQVCSSSSNRWFFFSSAVLQVPKSSLRDSILLFRTRVLKTRDLCGIFCPTHLAQRLAKRVFETRVLI